MSKAAELKDLRIVEPLHVRLRRLREQGGLTRSELAERTGLSRPTIWAWEMGKVKPRMSNLKTLADALGMSTGELVGNGNLVMNSNADVGAALPRQLGIIPNGAGNAQRLKIMIYAAKLGIAALAGVKAHNVKISIEL